MTYDRSKVLKSVFLVMTTFQILIGSSISQAQSEKPPIPVAMKITALLDKTGYNYVKVNDTVWEVPGTGKNLKEFPLRVVLADDIILFVVKLADRKSLNTKDPFAIKVLELNHQYDTAKIALSDDMLYVRIDFHSRLLNEEEFTYLIKQVATVADETYPQIKSFIVSAK